MKVKTKKQKAQKCVSSKKPLKFEDYKKCLEATQLKNKINQLEKSKVNVDSLRKNQKEFIKNNKLILKVNHSKDLEARNIKYLLKKFTRLYGVLTTIKEYNRLFQ